MRRYIYGLVVIISTLWGLSFLATSVLIEYLDPYQIQAVRWLIASVVFLVLIACRKLTIDFRKPGLKYALLLGAFEPCMYMSFETYGIAMTSASTAAIFVATIPSAVLLLNLIFFKKRLELKGVLGILIAFCGVAVCTVFSPDFSLDGGFAGYFVLLCAIFSGAMYSIVSNKLADQFSPLELTAIMAFIGTIFFGIMNFVLGYGTKTYTVYFSNSKLLASIAFLGICCSAICYLAFNKILSLVNPAIGNNLSTSMTTVVGVIAGIIFVGDSWGIYTVIGVIMTLIGVVLSSRELGHS